MSSEIDRLDATLIDTLRKMAQQGQRPSEMFREIKECLGMDMHVLTIVEYFRHAFCLTLLEAKPVVALSRNEQRQIENESAFDELLVPSILAHREEWEPCEQ